MFVLPSFVILSAARAVTPDLLVLYRSTMGKKRKQLSQAEIWDDSALLDSWNEALAEYKV